MAKQPRANAAPIPRSRRLFEAGFKTRDDAARCIEAIISDLAADRINAMEANELTSASLRSMRDFDRKAKRQAPVRPPRPKPKA